MTNNLPVYILCGGRSSRMKREKGLVEFRGMSFIRHILNAVEPLAEACFLVTGKSSYGQFGFPLVPDIFPDRGPLGGIYTALEHSSRERVMVLSCDIPLITGELIDLLVHHSHNQCHQISFLADQVNDYPLVGLYHQSLKPSLLEDLKGNRLKVRQFIKGQDFQRISLSSEQASFLENINTQSQLKSLENRREYENNK